MATPEELKKQAEVKKAAELAAKKVAEAKKAEAEKIEQEKPKKVDVQKQATWAQIMNGQRGLSPNGKPLGKVKS